MHLKKKQTCQSEKLHDMKLKKGCLEIQFYYVHLPLLTIHKWNEVDCKATQLEQKDGDGKAQYSLEKNARTYHFKLTYCQNRKMEIA